MHKAGGSFTKLPPAQKPGTNCLYAGRNSTAPPRRVSTRYLRFNGKYRRGQGRAIPSRRRSRSEHLQRLIQGELRHLIKIASLLAGGGAAGRRGPFDTLQTLARVDEGRPLTGHRLLHGLVELPASLPELIARLLYLPEIQLVDLGDGDVIARVDEVRSEPFDLVAVMAFLEDVIFLRAFGVGVLLFFLLVVCVFVGCVGGLGL